MMRRVPAVVRFLLAAAALAAVVGVAGEQAFAAPWCGTLTTEDRPATVTGRPIRLVYAIPSDGVDRSAERAPKISADIDEVAAWWAAQDSSREPRFDRAAFSCGPQADILVVRLPHDSGALSGGARFERIVDGVSDATRRSLFEKHLVYYDGPVAQADTCGQGGGTAEGPGVGIVYLAACTDVPSAAVAAHELLHALGALPDNGPPHACPGDGGHPCDSTGDVLYPKATGAALASLVLDHGRDDYYGHASAWLDVQDSGWLRLGQQVELSVAVTGRGSVESDLPGLDCSAQCVTGWDAGSVLSLDALAAEGQRFVRWTGACNGPDSCEVTLAAAQSVGAFFAPERFGLVVSLTGKGTVSGAGTLCRIARCVRSATSFEPLRLRAKAATGWRFVGWSGACARRTVTCTLPMAKATSVRARFVRS
jgi:Divergent InlB B-repeat domain